jgi:hypothetical protein
MVLHRLNRVSSRPSQRRITTCKSHSQTRKSPPPQPRTTATRHPYSLTAIGPSHAIRTRKRTSRQTMQRGQGQKTLQHRQSLRFHSRTRERPRETARPSRMALQRPRHRALHPQNHLSSRRLLQFKKSRSTKTFSRVSCPALKVPPQAHPQLHDPLPRKNVPPCQCAALTLAKPPSSATKALKPMVRTRLGNMGTSMQRQGSGSSTPKSGRGTSPNFGRGGNDVWSWRKQTPATKEYSEEELQRQGVHLTARLTTGGDEGNKWADVHYLMANHWTNGGRWTTTGLMTTWWKRRKKSRHHGKITLHRTKTTSKMKGCILRLTSSNQQPSPKSHINTKNIPPSTSPNTTDSQTFHSTVEITAPRTKISMANGKSTTPSWAYSRLSDRPRNQNVTADETSRLCNVGQDEEAAVPADEENR